MRRAWVYGALCIEALIAHCASWMADLLRDDYHSNTTLSSFTGRNGLKHTPPYIFIQLCLHFVLPVLGDRCRSVASIWDYVCHKLDMVGLACHNRKWCPVVLNVEDEKCLRNHSSKRGVFSMSGERGNLVGLAIGILSECTTPFPFVVAAAT